MLVTRYHDEVVKAKPRPRAIHCHLRRLAKDVSGTKLSEINAEWWVAWAKKMPCSPASRKRYFTLLIGALSTADTLWRLSVNWPEIKRARAVLERAGLIGRAANRDRRISDDEIASIKAHAKSAVPLADIVDFAVLTAMRAAEITRIRWSDIDRTRGTVLVRDRKHPKHKFGNHQWVPLLGNALAIIDRQPKVDERIFPYKEESVECAFRRAWKAAKLSGLTFHGLRHEATSRLFEAGYELPFVAMVTGHLDWNGLRKYTHLKNRNPAQGGVPLTGLDVSA